MDNQNMAGSGNMGQKYPSCSCPHHRMGAVWMLAFGILFLFYAFGWFSWVFVMYAWPIIVILAALSKMFRHRCNCCMRDK